MKSGIGALLNRLFGPEPSSRGSHLWPRWVWLRALGLIFFSAFYSLLFQIRGLIGPGGILPAGRFLSDLLRDAGARAFWYTPTLLWLRSGDRALLALCWIGLTASLLLVLNFWPRAAIAVCFAAYLSFVAGAQEFSSYQSDGMLLEAALISWFLAPRGLRPRLGEADPPSRASLFLLQWEWFRIYFESGFVKLASHDPEWRTLTALDHYYENQPLPDWIGWYVQQLPHGFHASVAFLTLFLELAAVWMLFLPRRFRIACFLIVTPFQIAIILTSNLAFLNYLILALGFLLLDDQFFTRRLGSLSRIFARNAHAPAPESAAPQFSPALSWIRTAGRLLSGLVLTWIFYNTLLLLLTMIFPAVYWLPTSPAAVLEPLRVSNRYGLFAVMTTARYEIEFQGSRDGKVWAPYPFRYKPQDPGEPPRVFAPYQPRLDWNLWFASLGTWRDYPFVPRTEVLLLKGSPSVLSLFAGNPFPDRPPLQVRAVIWQYWFTDLKTKRAEGLWWKRQFLGLYAPTLTLQAEGSPGVVEMPIQ